MFYVEEYKTETSMGEGPCFILMKISGAKT